MTDFSLWAPIDNNFDSKQFLYHYTDVEKAIKILFYKKLLFSSLTNVNDTSEAKAKISFAQGQGSQADVIKNKINIIKEYIKDNSRFLKMLCFSMDSEEIIENVNSPKWMHFDRYRDLIGRGLALPRMWAQYAKNFTGVCLIFNRDKLLKEVSNSTAIFYDGKVNYNDFFESYKFSIDDINSLYNMISMKSNGRQVFTKMFQQNDAFIRYNFFSKLNDWKGENEYRILALPDDINYPLEVFNLQTFLDGIVVGEKMDSAFSYLIQKLANELHVAVKRLIIDSNCTYIE